MSERQCSSAHPDNDLEFEDRIIRRRTCGGCGLTKSEPYVRASVITSAVAELEDIIRKIPERYGSASTVLVMALELRVLNKLSGKKET